MTSMHRTLTSVLAAVLLAPGCATIRQGDVGVKRTFGKIDSEAIEPGLRFYNPLFTSIIRVPVRTVNLEMALALPSREGLNVQSEISILYRVVPEAAPKVLSEIGRDYEQAVIQAVFRSAAADVSARYMAKDMHSGSRAEIETAIAELMTETLSERGFFIEGVLMKSITLPPGLYEAVEAKLAAEQDAQRMEFVLQRERLEADRKRIAAEGERDAQQALTAALTPEVIEWNRIEAFRELALSPNAKVIIAPSENTSVTPLISAD